VHELLPARQLGACGLGRGVVDAGLAASPPTRAARLPLFVLPPAMPTTGRRRLARPAVGVAPAEDRTIAPGHQGVDRLRV